MSPAVDLNLVRAFVAVRESGSFTAAAQRLGVPRSTVSRAIAALEDTLGTELFRRTTRSVNATAAADALFDRVAPSLSSLEQALADVPEPEEVPTGLVRVTSTYDVGVFVLAETTQRFLARYPGTQVELRLGTALLDLRRDGIDLAVRIAPRGRISDSSLVTRRIGTLSLQLYAAPAYLARRGHPRTPADLSSHDWVSFYGGPPMQLTQAAGARLKVDMRTRVRCDDVSCARELICVGAGIGALPSFVADADAAAGRLVRVLPLWSLDTARVYLALPSRKHVPRRVTAYRDILLELLRQRPLSPGG